MHQPAVRIEHGRELDVLPIRFVPLFGVQNLARPFPACADSLPTLVILVGAGLLRVQDADNLAGHLFRRALA